MTSLRAVRGCMGHVVLPAAGWLEKQGTMTNRSAA